MSTTKPYSLMILTHPQATTKERDEVESLVRSWIEQRKGTVGHVATEQKRRLAYPIDHLHQATYTSVRFELEPQDLADLWDRLHRQKKVLRFRLLQQEARSEGKTLKDIPLRAATAETAKTAELPKKEKASIEKLDEKIEEILEEEVL